MSCTRQHRSPAGIGNALELLAALDPVLRRNLLNVGVGAFNFGCMTHQGEVEVNTFGPEIETD
jgi:hypothetical protein